MKNLIYAFRYLLKARGNNLTRVISLSLGLTVALMIFSYVNFQLTYNRDFPDKERVYQMFTHYNALGITGSSTQLTAPIAPALAEEMSQVEAATRFLYSRNTYLYHENEFSLKGYAVDTSFFEVLDFGTIIGNPKEIFLDPDQVMLSESAAKKLFGANQPVGKILLLKNKPLTVAGIFKDPPVNNNLEDFEIILSLYRFDPGTDFDGSDQYQTYLKLKPGCSISDIEAQLPAFWTRHNMDAEMAQYNQTFYFLPITRSYIEGMELGEIIYMLSAIAFITLFISCMNYVLISISTLVNRSKTIGMLKCNGAQKSDIFSLLLWETLIIILFSCLVAVVVILSCKDLFESMLEYKLSDIFAWERIYAPLLVILGTFLLGALLPAQLFTAIPVQAAFKNPANKHRRWKKGLLFLQIACVSTVISLMLVILLQYSKLNNSDPGYQYEKVLYFSTTQKKATYQTLLHELKNLPQVETAGLALSLPIHGYSGTPLQDLETDELVFSCRWDYIDENYLPLMEIPIVSGQNFTQKNPENEIIVNRAFAESLAGKESVISRNVKFSSPEICTIIGVTENFKMGAASGSVLPMVFYNHHCKMTEDTTAYTYKVHIKLKEMSEEGSNAVNEKIRQILNKQNLSVTALTESRQQALRFERSYRNTILGISLITFIILTLGLVGYIWDEVRRRRKEIAIRKVNGAQLRDLIPLFFRNFAWVLLPAIALGLALGYIAGGYWLKSYDTKIALSWWIFAGSAVIVFTVVYLVIFYLVRKSTQSNTTKFLV